MEKDQVLYVIDSSSTESSLSSAETSLTRAQESLQSAQKDYNEAASSLRGIPISPPAPDISGRFM